MSLTSTVYTGQHFTRLLLDTAEMFSYVFMEQEVVLQEVLIVGNIQEEMKEEQMKEEVEGTQMREEAEREQMKEEEEESRQEEAMDDTEQGLEAEKGMKNLATVSQFKGKEKTLESELLALRELSGRDEMVWLTSENEDKQKEKVKPPEGDLMEKEAVKQEEIVEENDKPSGEAQKMKTGRRYKQWKKQKEDKKGIDDELVGATNTAEDTEEKNEEEADLRPEIEIVQGDVAREPRQANQLDAEKKRDAGEELEDDEVAGDVPGLNQEELQALRTLTQKKEVKRRVQSGGTYEVIEVETDQAAAGQPPTRLACSVDSGYSYRSQTGSSSG